MYNFFYSFHNKQLAHGLFNRDPEDGTPSPPESVDILTEDSQFILAEDGNHLITE